MQKRIIICLDGTNNDPQRAETNVQRFYRMAARVPREQIVYYQPGVGTLAPMGVYMRMRRQVLMLLDSAAGWMIERHVTSAYRFLMETYETGDRIYVVGFSRGAFAARVLCGMLGTVGLLHPGMVEMVPFAWDEYLRMGPGRSPADRAAQFEQAARFKKRFSRSVSLSFLGLWDTVSAVGTPWQPRVFQRTAANRDVRVVRHAVALDERRAMFVQNLWRGNPKHKQDVKQVWFRGVHSDVGGGYPNEEAGLALIALAWMVREASACGVTFDAGERKKILGAVDPQQALDQLTEGCAQAPRHESLTDAWRLLEYLPMPRWEQRGDGWVRRWRTHRGASRWVPSGSLVHRSVYLRSEMNAESLPANLRDDVRQES